MLTFFRFNTLFHFLSLLLLVILLKLPFLGEKLPVLLPELEWMLVGEKIHEGNFLYKELWTNVGPLSAFIYWLIDLSFGRSQFAYEFIAMLLVYFQALYFVFICNTRHAFLERNYAPGLLYILLMNLSFDMSKLSPVLLATTFLLFAFNKTIKQLERREGVSDEVFEIGLYIGIAVLFYQPAMVFIIWCAASLIFFTNANLRQYFLTLLGFIIPVVLAALFFYFNDSLDEFQYNWFNGMLKIKQYSLEDFKSSLLAITLPAAFAFLGFLRQSQATRYSNYQQRIQQIMLLWVVVALLALFLSPTVSPMQFIIFIPCFAFFCTAFFLHFKGTFLPEFIFTSLVLVILFVQYQGATPIFGKGFEQLSDMRIKPRDLPANMRGQKMLIIGERIDEYKWGTPATCYLNWELSKIDLQNPDNYESIINIFDNFKKDPPKIIIDKQNVVPKIFERLPALAVDYKSTDMKGVYQRKF
ncbi:MULTISPECIES: hypothetical protein [Emticicia]|nr:MULTISPECIES: hypothetical protein [Emticicia]UTA69990.1 hypothetical protein MB380_09260 [Emticicia sp. 21SJ11W-3]